MLLAHVHHCSSFGPVPLITVEALKILADFRGYPSDGSMLTFLVRGTPIRVLLLAFVMPGCRRGIDALLLRQRLLNLVGGAQPFLRVLLPY